jgi:predicted TIM-barrel enzyme
MIEARALSESARLAALHGADAVIVTGDANGDAPKREQLREARKGIEAAGIDTPVLIGSGLNHDNAAQLLAESDGAIVGTALMRAGRIDARLAMRLADGLAGLAS